MTTAAPRPDPASPGGAAIVLACALLAAVSMAQATWTIDLSEVNRQGRYDEGAIHYGGNGSVRHSNERTYADAQHRREVDAAKARTSERAQQRREAGAAQPRTAGSAQTRSTVEASSRRSGNGGVRYDQLRSAN